MEEVYFVLKEKKKNIVKNIRGFVDSKFVKTCHEYVKIHLFVLFVFFVSFDAVFLQPVF